MDNPKIHEWIQTLSGSPVFKFTVDIINEHHNAYRQCIPNDAITEVLDALELEAEPPTIESTLLVELDWARSGRLPLVSTWYQYYNR